MENTVKITERPQNKNLKLWKKGAPSPNPKGRPLGQKNYATLRAEAIINIGKANGKTPEQIEVMIHEKGITEALKGDFRFYKDDLDRVHGQATEKHIIKGEIDFGKLNDLSNDELSRIIEGGSQKGNGEKNSGE